MTFKISTLATSTANIKLDSITNFDFHIDAARKAIPDLEQALSSFESVINRWQVDHGNFRVLKTGKVEIFKTTSYPSASNDWEKILANSKSPEERILTEQFISYFPKFKRFPETLGKNTENILQLKPDFTLCHNMSWYNETFPAMGDKKGFRTFFTKAYTAWGTTTHLKKFILETQFLSPEAFYQKIYDFWERIFFVMQSQTQPFLDMVTQQLQTALIELEKEFQKKKITAQINTWLETNS